MNAVVLHGCGSKDGEEQDGQEFEVENLVDFIRLLRNTKEFHLNYAVLGDESSEEIDLDLWIKVNAVEVSE